MTTSPIESQSGKLTQVLEGIKKGNTLVKNGKLTIPSEPSAYAEWYEKNKIVLEALSQSLTKALEDWNSFLGANATDISIIQEAEKKYNALTPADKATVDIYRKASTVAATLAQIQPKIQPSNYDDRKIVRNIKSGTVNTLTSASFLDDTTFTEGGIGSIKKLGKLGLDAIGQEYYLINFSGSKYGVLRIPKDESSVVQVAWLNSEQSESVQQGKYKAIRDNITNLPYANAELDGSSIVFNMRNIFANLPASIYDSKENGMAAGGILALEQAVVAAMVKLGGTIPPGKLKHFGEAVHKGFDMVGLGAKTPWKAGMTIAIGAAITYAVGVLATDRTLTRRDLSTEFFQGGPTETIDDSNNGNTPGNQPATEITL